MVPITSIIERTPIRFPNNPATMVVENGKVVGMYNTPEQYAAEWGDIPAVEVARPQANNLFKYDNGETVYGVVNGFPIPYTNMDELKAIDGDKTIESRRNALQPSDQMNTNLLQLMAPTLARDAAVPETLADFTKWLAANVTSTVTEDFAAKQPDGTTRVYRTGDTITGDDAIGYMAQGEFKKWRNNEINRYTTEQGLNAEDATSKFNQYIADNQATFDQSMAGYNTSLADLAKDRTTGLQNLDVQALRNSEDFSSNRSDLLIQNQNNVDDTKQSFAANGMYNREGAGLMGKGLERYSQAFESSKRKLETTYNRNIEDIGYGRVNLEEAYNRNVRDTNSAMQNTQSAWDRNFAPGGYVPEQNRIAGELATNTTEQGLSSINQNYDINQAEWGTNLRGDYYNQFGTAVDEYYRPDLNTNPDAYWGSSNG